MQNVLVLGAGMVTKPLVRYLLDLPDYHVKVASRTVSKAEKLIDNHPDGKAQTLNVKDDVLLEELISHADLVVSLVPYAYHVKIAELCIKHKKNMVTTSYVSDAMHALDGRARDAGILILNEIGLDPGIDHMSAMKIIHSVQNAGGKIISFCSYCGAIPSPEANTNPWGYKFSWSPRGVVLAGKNEARYLKDGQEIYIPGKDLFAHHSPITIEGIGELEYYPNRNSLPYIETYGLQTTKTMFRGTLRYPGWSATWKKMVDLGFLDDNEIENLQGKSYKDFIGMLIKSSPENDIKKDLASYLQIEEDSKIMKRFEWLGLLSDASLSLEKGSPIDILSALLLEKLTYDESERDMTALQHNFIAEYTDRKEKITSTLIDYGIPGGDSAVARTVSLPAAIATKLILQGDITTTGVHIPVSALIYEPVLKELERTGLIFKEIKEPL